MAMGSMCDTRISRNIAITAVSENSVSSSPSSIHLRDLGVVHVNNQYQLLQQRMVTCGRSCVD